MRCTTSLVNLFHFECIELFCFCPFFGNKSQLNESRVPFVRGRVCVSVYCSHVFWLIYWICSLICFVTDGETSTYAVSMGERVLEVDAVREGHSLSKKQNKVYGITMKLNDENENIFRFVCQSHRRPNGGKERTRVHNSTDKTGHCPRFGRTFRTSYNRSISIYSWIAINHN